MGNSGCFPRWKLAATKSYYPTNGACWVFFQCFHNPSNSDMDYRVFNVRTDVNACKCTRGMYGHAGESLHWNLTLGEKSLAAPGNRTCVSASQSHTLLTVLHPHPHTDLIALLKADVDEIGHGHCSCGQPRSLQSVEPNQVHLHHASVMTATAIFSDTGITTASPVSEAPPDTSSSTSL